MKSSMVDDVVVSVCASADGIAELLPKTAVGMTDSDSKNPVAIIIPFVAVQQKEMDRVGFEPTTSGSTSPILLPLVVNGKKLVQIPPGPFLTIPNHP
jgi:hypothetical protein